MTYLKADAKIKYSSKPAFVASVGLIYRLGARKLLANHKFQLQINRLRSPLIALRSVI